MQSFGVSSSPAETFIPERKAAWSNATCVVERGRGIGFVLEACSSDITLRFLPIEEKGYMLAPISYSSTLFCVVLCTVVRACGGVRWCKVVYGGVDYTQIL
jgi:hypothetical protein